MSFRGGLKKGGGFWNNVDGKITGYLFTNVGPGDNGEETEWVYFVPSVRVDGAEADTTQHMFLGAVERYDISEDGLTLTAVDSETTSIGAGTPAGKFLDSLVEKGFPEDELPDLEGGEPLNLEGIINKRIRLTQQEDVEGTKKLGKRKSKDGKKEYPRTDTVVGAYYGAAEAETKGAKGKTAAKPAAAAKGKAKADDVSEFAAETLVKILKANKGTLNKSKLSVKVLATITRDPRKEAVRKYLFNDDNLGAIEGVEYDAESGDITLEG